MSKSKNKKNSGVAKTVIIIVVIILLLFGIASAIIALTRTPSFYIQINGGEIISKDVSDYAMPGDVEIKVKSTNSDNAIYIFAKEADSDFSFEFGGQTHTWLELVYSQRDFSDAFNVQAIDGGFKLNTASLSKILALEFGETVNLDNTAIPAGDLFELIVYSGDEQISVSFHMAKVNYLYISPDSIVF